MGAEDRTPHFAVVPDTVEAHLRREPFGFQFFQAVQLLERLTPRATPVGRLSSPPHSETVRFTANLSVAFPASEIQALGYDLDAKSKKPAKTPDGPVGPPRMQVNFMGLVGPQGIMPLYYTEYLALRVREGDTAARDFFDIFNHRLTSLFYRAWQKYRFQTMHGRQELDRFGVYLLNLLGLGHSELQRRQLIPDTALAFYTGLVTQQPCSALALENVLTDYFDVPVGIEQFVGSWYRLDERTQTSFRDSEEISEMLGGGAVVGDEVWEPQARLRVVLGPLPIGRYRDFLPTGSAYEPLRTLVRFMAGGEFDFELQLILERGDVPNCELGSDGAVAPMLGWLSWAKSKAMGRDPQETILPL